MTIPGEESQSLLPWHLMHPACWPLEWIVLPDSSSHRQWWCPHPDFQWWKRLQWYTAWLMLCCHQRYGDGGGGTNCMNVRRFEWTITKARQNTDRFILQQGVILNKVNEKSIGSRGVATSCFRDPAACFISEISFITAGPLILCKPDLGLISMNLVAKHHQRGENLTCLGFVFLQDCEGVIALTVFGWRNVKEKRSGVQGSTTLKSSRTWQVKGSQHVGVELNKFSRVLNLFAVMDWGCTWRLSGLG